MRFLRSSFKALFSHARLARTIVPSLTLPSHSSMLSGVSFEKHGIDWNNWQPERGTIRVPTLRLPIMGAAEKVTAMRATSPDPSRGLQRAREFPSAG